MWNFFCFVFLLLLLSKASIIGRKKEAVAEKLQEAMDEVWWVHANLNWSREGYLAVALWGNWRRNFSRKKGGRKFCMLTCTKRVFVCKDKLYNLMRINLCILLKTKKSTVKKCNRANTLRGRHFAKRKYAPAFARTAEKFVGSCCGSYEKLTFPCRCRLRC